MNSMEFIRYIQNLQYSNYGTVCNNLINHAFVVGKGDYGTAFRLKDGRVVKIFKSYDTAYKTFLKMVMVMDNPHLPEIYCVDEYAKFGWVILEFLNEWSMTSYMNLNLLDITKTMTGIIKGIEVERVLELSLHELAEEMREYAPGFCLDFRQPNFAERAATLIVLDPFTLKTKYNEHLYIEKKVKVAGRSK